jgi:hypothetical protein
VSERYELNTSCHCQQDCQGNLCWEIAKEDIDIMMTDWFESITNNNIPNAIVKFSGKNMGWTRATGYAYASIDDGLQPLYINSDFRLVATRDGDNLTVVRYSHDEPVGASFTLTIEQQETGD